jgi:ATP-binding cassette subfamily F protein 3
MERLRKAKREQDEEVARVKMFIDRFRYQATKASQVQSRIKMLEKVVPIEAPPERKTDPLHVSGLREERPIGARTSHTCARRTADSDLLGPRSPDRTRRSHRARRPERRGKSTLMRMLSGVEAPDSGTRREGIRS